MDDAVTRRDAAKQPVAPLPAVRAFVVQLRAETEPAGELFVGRAEHVGSGSVQRFGSAAELIDFITRTLAPADDPHPAGGAREPGATSTKETRS